MGFIEVLFNLRVILNNIKLCKADIVQFGPDAIIFIDYPGFNMRIAKWAKERHIPTHYYISPQIWAWKENRISQIKRDVDFMYVILPFEKDFYEKKHSYNVEFVGHPLIDAIHDRTPVDAPTFRESNNLDQRPIIALLPGSRKQEISKLLSVMLSAVKHFPDYQIVIAGAPGQDPSFYDSFLIDKNVKLIVNQTYDLLDLSHAALVTSGTATLETALFKVPEVVCYKGSWASYQIAKRIITLKYISLVNLIMNEEVVTELIQDECNTERIVVELKKILTVEYRNQLQTKYDMLELKLGGIGASSKVAKLIVHNFTKE